METDRSSGRIPNVLGTSSHVDHRIKKKTFSVRLGLVFSTKVHERENKVQNRDRDD